MISNVFLNIILGFYFAHVGLAIATSISALLNAGSLYYYLNKQSIFNASSNLYQTFFKALVASFIMIVFILIFGSEVNIYLKADVSLRITLLGTTIVLAIVVYFSSLKLLNMGMKKQ